MLPRAIRTIRFEGKPKPLWLALSLLLLTTLLPARAETVATLPNPTGYVSDFAQVIDPATRQQIETLCMELNQQTNAQIEVVTIHTLEGVPAADFANALEEKWKVGKKGQDRGVLMLYAVDDKKRWYEIGYGLEGILNDAKVGDIGRAVTSVWETGNHSQAIAYGVQQIGQVIAEDAHVTLQPIVHPQRVQHEKGSIVPFLILFVIVLVLGGLGAGSGAGPGGLFYFLLGNLMGGVLSDDGRRGEGHTGGWFGGDGRGGGFGGGDSGPFGGGGSGGGGAGGDL